MREDLIFTTIIRYECVTERNTKSVCMQKLIKEHLTPDRGMALKLIHVNYENKGMWNILWRSRKPKWAIVFFGFFLFFKQQGTKSNTK